ncbi:unnamed protein product [Caenorhabditis bovis]|uniref:Major sperm protein n=1 Tax=Caenorhabditis bovis TaxID=2654633 RepID=A0A8S1EP21_9PELO|nr:unnamed protein product [Caenorhabditis bovis]
MSHIGKKFTTLSTTAEVGGGDGVDDLNIMMAARESQIVQEDKMLGGFVGAKEIGILAAVSLSIYLINGTHAQAVCTALTSVPPALFSYRVLINPRTTRDGYHSILFYWTLYGVMALADQLFGDAQGYHFIKGSLLVSVFWHALRANPSSIPRSLRFIDEATSHVASALTRYDSQGFEKLTETSDFMPRSPTMTQFSEDDESEYMLPTSPIPDESEATVLENPNDFDLTTACSFIPSMEMQTTQKPSPEDQKNQIRVETGKDAEEKLYVGYESTGFRQAIRAPTPIHRQQFLSMSAMTLTNGGADIVTNPHDKLEFSREVREVPIRVTNISALHLMFALKTNADTYLVAAPTTGVIKSGDTLTIRVGVADHFFKQFSDLGRSIDKLAIDYMLIPQGEKDINEFSYQFFAQHNRRRHAIRVFYK